MLVQVTTIPTPKVQVGDLVDLKGEAYLVIEIEVAPDKYNLVNMKTGKIYFLKNQTLTDLDKDLKQRNSVIYSCSEYIFDLKRRTK